MIKEQKSEVEKATLWVVSELYYPEETSTGYYLTKIAEGLADDFRVRVICGQPTYSRRGTLAPRRETHKCVEILRARATTLDKNVLAFKMINMLTLSMSVFWSALRNFSKGDRVLVVTNPPTMPFVCALASLVKGASYILLIHDNYPEILIAAGKSKPESVFVRIMNHANRWLYKFSSRIIVCGRDMKELVERKTAGLDVPIGTIQNWAELETVSPRPRDENELLREIGMADRFVFLYAGNMGYPNDVESIVECATRYAADPRFGFIFLGGGVKRRWIENEVSNRGLQNVRVLDPRPRSEQNVFLNACDVALVSLVPQMWGVSVPSRTYNILAVGKPILALAEPGSEVTRVIEDDRVGWYVSPANPDGLCDILEAIASTPASELRSMGVRAREAALARYSVETAIGRFRVELGAPSRPVAPGREGESC